ncbi:MAG: hypothetical protein RR804_16015 [Massilia sp.]
MSFSRTFRSTFRHTVLAASLLAGLSQVGAHAASLPAPFDTQLAADFPKLEAFYRDLHANPELGFAEHKTAAKLAERVEIVSWDRR